MTGAPLLAEELRHRSYEVEVITIGGLDYVVVNNYVVMFGRHKDRRIRLALPCPPDFPVTPPGGMHTNPRLAQPGANSIHNSPLGGDWSYWSRPIPDWQKARTTARIMSHLNTLFERAA
ncbi:MAG: hypothetical protein H6806_11070 [Planctomycetes bacterium]|nr:hypothetical protein [Myxococcales bacterium]MCB9508287.1 hypothetical protein [Myxococcales bacterium]MCB9830286.1 hypothetical protein [Planctomycetota bacterium]